MLRLLFFLLLIYRCSASKFLYDDDVPEVDDVGELEKMDDKIQLVEFYSPYCVSCFKHE